jgi:[acyl-carrier-protein] S-malonyltransferase
MSLALVFPGMGPIGFTDVSRFLVLNPIGRRYVADADAVLGYSLLDRFETAEKEYTEYAQVAFLVSCLALAEWAERTLDLVPEVCAAASFGSKAAAVRSGALGFEQMVWLTAELARYENEYFSSEHKDLVTHSFTRTPGERLDEILADLAGPHYISCHIDDDFYMVTLREQDVDWLVKKIREGGGMSLYTMRPAMHFRALTDLRETIEADLFGQLRFADPVLPVVADQDGRVVRDAEGVRRMLLDGYVETVRWPKVVDTLAGLGIGTVAVCGPDSLFGKVRCTTESFEVIGVDPVMAMRPRPEHAGA